MSEHNHPKLLVPAITLFTIIGSGTFLISMISTPLIKGYTVIVDLTTVIVIFFGILLIIAGIIILKEIVKIINQCEVCK